MGPQGGARHINTGPPPVKHSTPPGREGMHFSCRDQRLAVGAVLTRMYARSPMLISSVERIIRQLLVRSFTSVTMHVPMFSHGSALSDAGGGGSSGLPSTCLDGSPWRRMKKVLPR